MNVEIGAKAAQFPEKEYINGIALAVQQGIFSPFLVVYVFVGHICRLRNTWTNKQKRQLSGDLKCGKILPVI
jgi:hypothetical protein